MYYELRFMIIDEYIYIFKCKKCFSMYYSKTYKGPPFVKISCPQSFTVYL